MPRRKGAFKERGLQPEAKFDSVLATQFVNKLMRQGKKTKAEKIFYEAVDLLEQRGGQPGVNLVKQAVSNVKPVLEVKSRRVGGATYQVPVEVRPDRGTSLAIRWIISFARSRSEESMAERLAAELLDAAQNEGAAVRRREEIHRMAEANRAFAHYRW